MIAKFPAILGGVQAFESPVEVVRPLLPDADVVAAEVVQVLKSGRLSNNAPTVQRFESEISEWLGVRHAVAMSNGTLTLVLALKALGLHGKVIVPSFTFCATAHAVVWAGLEPVFADIDPRTLNITPETVEAALAEDVCAVMPVHVFGSPCDLDGLEALARRHGLKLVYDSAQAMGSTYRERRLGVFGDAESFSVHATKLLPTGEGGIVTTEDDALAERLRQMRNFGLDAGADCLSVGLNAKMCEFPAVLGALGIGRLEHAISRRHHLAQKYQQSLRGIPGLAFQEHPAEVQTNYQNFVILVDEDEFGLSRDELAEALRADNIHGRKYFYPAIHNTTAYVDIARRQPSLPVTESVARRCLCLPLYSDMADEVVDRICSSIRSIHRHATDVRRALAGEVIGSVSEPYHHPLAAKEVSPSAVARTTKTKLSIALPSRPKGLYDEIGRMLLDVLSDSDYSVSIVGDGDESALEADELLMIGDCMEFESYAALLGSLPGRKPVTALWLLDTLPPALLNDRAAQIGGRIGLYNRGLHIMGSRLRPIRDVIPLSIRRKVGLSACSALLHGIESAMSEESQEELRKLDVNSQYEIFGRYEWIKRNYPQGWLDRIFVNTKPKLGFLSSMGISATFIPLGYHPNMGRHLGIERDIDVLFIGELEYGRRKTIVEYIQQELQQRGRSVTVIGSGCYGDARIEMMNRAKISLNVPRFPWDIPTIRVFLSIGCGSMVISEQMGDTSPFVSGKHVVQSGVTDLPDLICHYLEHDDERDHIVQNAFDLIRNELTLQRSVTRVLESTLSEQRMAA